MISALYARSKSGYTLVELSIVLVIVSLLTAGGLSVGVGMVNRAAHIDTNKIIEQLDQSLRDYYTVNSRLPCVASLTTPITDSSFGTELVNGSQECDEWASEPAGTKRVDMGGNVYVRIGMIPARTLGLSDKAASDKYGNRILYAVTEKLTDPDEFGDALGAIIVNDGNGNPILNEAAYFLASLGKDHKGAFFYSTGEAAISCTPSTELDAANCDENGVFRDAPFNSGTLASHFDDQVRWSPKYHLSAMSTSSDTLWAKAPVMGDHVYAVGTDGDPSNTNVGIGTDNPKKKLTVKSGSILLEDGDAIIADNAFGSMSMYFNQSGVSPGFFVRSVSTPGDTSTYTDRMVVRPTGTVEAAAFKGNGGQITGLGACVAYDTTIAGWAWCPSGYSWVMGFSTTTTSMQMAMPAANYWHRTTAWICCK